MSLAVAALVERRADRSPVAGAATSTPVCEQGPSWTLRRPTANPWSRSNQPVQPGLAVNGSPPSPVAITQVVAVDARPARSSRSSPTGRRRDRRGPRSVRLPVAAGAGAGLRRPRRWPGAQQQRADAAGRRAPTGRGR